MKYIFIRDSHENENLWQIIDEVEGVYTVKRYGTVDFIHSGLCFEVEGSCILHTNIVIDFEKTPLFEDEEWYAEHEKFMNCECFNCWMIEVQEEE